MNSMKINIALFLTIIVLFLVLSMRLFFIEKTLKNNKDLNLILLNSNQELLKVTNEIRNELGQSEAIEGKIGSRTTRK